MMTGLYVIVMAVVGGVCGRSMLFMGEKVEDCTKGGATFGDWSGIEYEYVNDTAYFLNGALKINKRVRSPWRMHYFIEKYDRGQWHTSIVDREIPDFCKVIGDKRAPWRMFVNHLKRKSCPFEAGYVEKFDMEYVSEAVLPDYYGLTMMGQYRVFIISHFLDEKEKAFEECLKLTFEIMPA